MQFEIRFRWKVDEAVHLWQQHAGGIAEIEQVVVPEDGAIANAWRIPKQGAGSRHCPHWEQQVDMQRLLRASREVGLSSGVRAEEFSVPKASLPTSPGGSKAFVSPTGWVEGRGNNCCDFPGFLSLELPLCVQLFSLLVWSPGACLDLSCCYIKTC